MKKELKSVGVLSCGKISGIVYGFMGLILGSILSLVVVLELMPVSLTHRGDFPDILVGIGAIIFLPIVYAVSGFITGVIAAFIYNLAASFFGGLEFEVGDVSSSSENVVAPPGPAAASQ